MSALPSYLLPRPPATEDTAAAAAFDALFDRAVAGGGGAIDYDLPWPRWQFICHVADTRPIILHGSQNGEIEHFEPRQASDAHPFGDRKAVFGASDGLWPIYYAILDRARHPMSLVNAAVRIEDPNGDLGPPHYFFSITQAALAAKPFRPGMIYLLPRQSFEAMPPETIGGRRVHVAQWASLEPVRPIARIAVEPEDFPFLDQIRGHDDDRIWKLAKADPEGFPWVES